MRYSTSGMRASGTSSRRAPRAGPWARRARARSGYLYRALTDSHGPLGDLSLLASNDPRVRFAAEDRLRAAGVAGIAALEALIAADDIPQALQDRATDLRGTILCEGAITA